MRSIALRPDGSYFLCGLKGGGVVFVDTGGIAYRFIHRKGGGNVHAGVGEVATTKGDNNSTPHSVTLAPNEDAISTCNNNVVVSMLKACND